jgi:hypothetical protein
MDITVQAKHTNEEAFKTGTVDITQQPVVGTPTDASKVDQALNNT